MLFNSYQFLLIFLPAVLIAAALIRRYGRPSQIVPLLSLASFAFYAYWDLRYVPLLATSILVNYVAGRALGGVTAPPHRKILLVAALCANLALLGYFKYAGFFVENVNAVLDSGFRTLSLVLPLGISFFTFTQIEYLVDAYREEVPRYALPEYVLFVTFFPHLVAGPILRHHEVIPQFRDELRVGPSDTIFASGFLFLAIGLFKKVVIADPLAEWVELAFTGAGALTLVDSWMGALAYTFQLYFDFSGYSDMAVGIALMLNVRIPLNFASPYKAASIGDFWRRWHISLSKFLRDYVYIPLGGSRVGRGRTVVNLMGTMLLGGLWHGAGWTFVIWGAWHGLLLGVDHGLKWLKVEFSSWVTRPITFIAVVVGWVVFRSPSWAVAQSFLGSMAGTNGVTLPTELTSLLGGAAQAVGISVGPLVGMPEGTVLQRGALLLGLILFVSVLPNTQELVARIKPRPVWFAFATVTFLYAFLLTGQVSEFLYYQF